MNYDNPELLDRLASEYVLGTMRGAARRRFERILRETPEARAAVAEWENRLAGLTTALPEQTPSAAVWRGIEARIHPQSTTNQGFWRGWAIFTSIALAIVSALFVLETTQTPQLDDREVAFVNEANSTPLWVVSMDFNTGELSTRAVSAEALELDQEYQLWMLPEQGDPQSLGLMPVNGEQTVQAFSPALLDLLRNAKGLAVSIEPPGGSPISTPTGPVVYQAPLVKL